MTLRTIPPQRLQCFGGPMDGGFVSIKDLPASGAYVHGISAKIYRPEHFTGECFWYSDWASYAPDWLVTYQLSSDQKTLHYEKMKKC